MNRNLWTFIAVCAAGAFGLLLIAMWRAGPPPPPAAAAAAPATMVLRPYDVPSAQADDIRTALSDSLSMGEGQVPMGRVSSAGPGRILVLAPESIQVDVAKAIATLGVGEGQQSVSTVELELWSIDAVPGEGADDPSLAPIADALQAARPSLGGVRFMQRDALSITALTNGDSMNARTDSGFNVSGNLRARNGGVTARLGIGSPQLSTSLDLAFGQALVIARIAAGEGRTQLLVARARATDAPN